MVPVLSGIVLLVALACSYGMQLETFSVSEYQEKGTGLGSTDRDVLLIGQRSDALVTSSVDEGVVPLDGSQKVSIWPGCDVGERCIGVVGLSYSLFC